MHVCFPFLIMLNRLEENSTSLTQQVDRLAEELDQERKKYRMLEIKLRNSERAREDADNRNRLLQNEMEEFFSTLGNLTMGTRTNKLWHFLLGYNFKSPYSCIMGVLRQFPSCSKLVQQLDQLLSMTSKFVSPPQTSVFTVLFPLPVS